MSSGKSYRPESVLAWVLLFALVVLVILSVMEVARWP